MIDPQFGKVIQLRKSADIDTQAAAEVEPYDDAIDGRVVDGDEEYDEFPHPVVEHFLYVVAGTGVVARKVWRSHTADYDESMRAAQAVGDHTTALEWEDRRRE